MDLTSQIIRLLSEPPGSFIYHLVTLFAVQVVFAISYSRWRRQPEDEYARNMSWAAGAIFIGRLLLLMAGLYFGRNPASAAAVLPPLEQAINTASILLLVWALVPPLDRYPRALDIFLVVSLALTGVMYLFFAQEWQNQLAGGVSAFHGTAQATTWTLMQIAVLAAGLGYLLFLGRSLGALPPIILGILLAAHIIHLWNFPEFVPTDTNVAYWIRLGNLIALPLWAVYAYLHEMKPLLESESRLQGSVEKFGVSLEQAAQVITTQQPQRRLAYSLAMINQMFDSSFTAIGLTDAEDETVIEFYSSVPNQSPGEIKEWQMDLSEQVTLNAALKQDGSTQLFRDGLGSRALYSFFEAADLEPTSTLLIHPLATNGNRIGLLAVPLPGNGSSLPDEAQNLVPGLAHFVAQAMVNSQPAPAPQELEQEPEPEIHMPAAAVPAAIIMDNVRVQDLEYQLEQLREEVEEAEQKRRHAEANATAAQKQARYLAAALRTIQSGPNNSEQTAAVNEVTDTARQEDAEADIDPIA